MLTLLPLALMFSGASFDALKSLSIIVSIPLAVILIFLVIGLFQWLKEDRAIPGRLHFVQDDMVNFGKPYEEDEVIINEADEQGNSSTIVN